MLIEANALGREGVECWIFCHGMLFNSPDKWWGDHGPRDYPHEGIDLCLYRDASGRRCRLDENTRIPVMHDGVIRALFKDYLGRALIIEHEATDPDTGRFLTMYAHTAPLAGIDVGASVKEGDIIATLADTRHSKAGIVPHLHLSFGLPSTAFSYEGFVWNFVRRPDMMTLQDPLIFLDRPYRALDAGHTACLDL
jgi:murein DD-endopeptidase MepM/ murein hydrolase activator NlpD